MPKIVWRESFYVEAFELARQGLSDPQIAEALGVSRLILKKWKIKRPAFAEAIARGRQGKHKAQEYTFKDYVYDRLPPALQRVWKELMRIERERSGIMRVEALLENQGKTARQHLFVHALVHGSFNQSYACRMVNVSKKTLDNWITTDPDFASLIDEITWHKKNFFEAALVQRVSEGDVHAAIFVNKTINKDRGYGEKVQHEHSGQINHQVAVLNLDDFDIPLSVRKQMLDQLREKKSLPLQTTAEVQHV